MTHAINEFDLLVNSYYQAYGLKKKIIASGVFGNIFLLPEIKLFRDNLKAQPMLLDAIEMADKQIEKSPFEMMMIEMKIEEIYKLNKLWLREILNSVDNYPAQDMTAYRLSFQMARDQMYKMLKEAIGIMDPRIPRTTAIGNLINSILNANYWEGDDVLRDINAARTFKSVLKYSDNWILEYMVRLLKNT